MSPEVITGSLYATEADIWSLGITAIEMTQGLPPHANLHPMRAMFKIPLLPSPRLDKPTIREFEDFIAKCLVKDVKERSTAEQLLQHEFLREVENRDVLQLKGI